MSFKEQYTPEEWRTLQFAPLWVFAIIAGADKKVDDKETAALAKELQEAALFKDPLAREVLLSVAGDLAATMQAFRADTRNAVTGLRNVASLLKTKATTENAQKFKRAMLLIGKNTAEASGGGFLGLGKKISDEEKKALLLVALSLEVAPGTAAPTTPEFTEV